MRKYLLPTADTTIYEAFKTNNSGLDEILELGKVVDITKSTTSYESSSARILINFELPTTESVSADAKYFLNLRFSSANNIYKNQQVLIYQISQPWNEGSGFFYQNVKNASDGATWQSASNNVAWNTEGGDFLLTETSQSFSLSTYPLQDVKVDVTNIVQPIVSQSLQDNFYGLALQFPVSDEVDIDNTGNIKFFSVQTHTIHQPMLEVAWDDQVFTTGSLKSVPSLDVKIAPSNLRQVYTKGDVDKLLLVVRDPYPLKSFDSTLRYKNKYYLPQTSYYSIIDVQSNTTIVPFDDYSKVHTDTNSSYINLDTSPLYAGRFYKLKLKLVNGMYSKTVDTETLFKVE